MSQNQSSKIHMATDQKEIQKQKAADHSQREIMSYQGNQNQKYKHENEV